MQIHNFLSGGSRPDCRSGMKAMTALLRRNPPHHEYILPFRRHKEVLFHIVSLYRLQMELITIANKIYIRSSKIMI